MSGNIVLIGFMGAGKSAVGAALARALDYTVRDTDEMVEHAAGSSIEEIWAHEGEAGFRERERKAVIKAVRGSKRVIACGGGAIVQMKNYGRLKRAGTVVYLRASADVLRARCLQSGGRPLLRDPRAFDRLLAERTPAYEAAADVIVDVTDGTPEEIAATIMEQLT